MPRSVRQLGSPRPGGPADGLILCRASDQRQLAQ